MTFKRMSGAAFIVDMMGTNRLSWWFQPQSMVSSPISVVVCKRDVSTAAFTMSTSASPDVLTTMQSSMQSIFLRASLTNHINFCLLVDLDRNSSFLPENSVSAVKLITGLYFVLFSDACCL